MQSLEKTSQIPAKFDSRFVFVDTLTRVGRIIGEEKTLETLVMNTQLPYVFTNEPVPLNFNYSINEGVLFNSNSKISWTLTHKNILSPINLTFNLTENTLENTVLVVFEIFIEKRELIPEEFKKKIISTFPKISVEMINNLDKLLQEDNKDIYQYESKIFNYSRDKIWDILINFHKLMIRKGIIRNFYCSDESRKEGTIFSFESISSKKNCKIKIIKCKNDEKLSKWVINFLPLEGPFRDIENDWILVKIEENKTMVININKYSEHIEPEILKQLSANKIKVFKGIEDELKANYKDIKSKTNDSK